MIIIITVISDCRDGLALIVITFNINAYVF